MKKRLKIHEFPLWKGGWLSAIAIVILFSSCGKNDDNGAADLKSQLVVFHTAPDVAMIDFYLNGSKQNTTALTYADIFGYADVSAGDQTADVKIPVTNSIITFAPVSFLPNVPYSLFIAGLSNSNNLSIVVTVDTVGALPAEGKAKIRFIQVSPSTQSMDLLANDEALFSNRAFKSVTPFTDIVAKKYAFKIHSAGNGNELTVNDSLDLQDGGLYTLYTEGIVGVDTPDIASFKLSVFKNH